MVGGYVTDVDHLKPVPNKKRGEWCNRRSVVTSIQNRWHSSDDLIVYSCLLPATDTITTSVQQQIIRQKLDFEALFLKEKAVFWNINTKNLPIQLKQFWSDMFVQLIYGLLAGSLPKGWARPHGEKTRTTTQNLYVSHYDGHVFSLTLDTEASTLTLTDTLQACGGMPSWLTIDAATSTLYCVDESGTSANVGNGSLSSFAVYADGSLKETAKVTTLPAGVASVIYEGHAGKKYLAIAH
jgi:hypothetical protein